MTLCAPDTPAIVCRVVPSWLTQTSTSASGGSSVASSACTAGPAARVPVKEEAAVTPGAETAPLSSEATWSGAAAWRKR